MNPAAKTETVLPLAAFFQLTEKPHLGHPLPTAVLYPGIGSVNSNTASGLRVRLYDSGRRSRSTGKERDAESGLDYFGARYLSSAQGRWTSPDKPFVDQHPKNPQSWNMYGYVRNNPLKNIDPNGKQSCAISPSMCRSVVQTPAGTPSGKDVAIAAAIAGGPAAIALAPETAVGAGILATARGLGSALLGWLLGHPQQVQETGAAVGEAFANVPPGSLTGNLARLTANEISTGMRFAEQEGLQLSASTHVGEEFVDAAGRTYDAMGQPAAYQHWNADEFLSSISDHLNKANDYTIIDLKGANADQVSQIKNNVDGLDKALQDKIRFVQ